MICARCDGTGNELLAMYLRCTACSGTGEVAPCLVFTERDYVLTGDCEHDCQTACAYPGQFTECTTDLKDPPHDSHEPV